MRRIAVLATLSLSVMAGLLVLPATASAEGIISSLSVSPSSVRDGASSQGTVTLIPDVTPTTVLLFSSDPSVATVPPSVIAPAGQGTVTLTIATNAAALLRPARLGLQPGGHHGAQQSWRLGDRDPDQLTHVGIESHTGGRDMGTPYL